MDNDNLDKQIIDCLDEINNLTEDLLSGRENGRGGQELNEAYERLDNLLDEDFKQRERDYNKD